MSYLDYGGICLKRQGDNWVRYREAEDTSLVRLSPTTQKSERIIEVLASLWDYYDKKRQGEEVNFLLHHPHHIVVGSAEGVAILAYKTSLYVAVGGKEIVRFYLSGGSPDDIHKVTLGETKILVGWAKVESTEGVTFLAKFSDEEIYCGLSGYGVRDDQTWKDPKTGRVYLYRYSTLTLLPPDSPSESEKPKYLQFAGEELLNLTDEFIKEYERKGYMIVMGSRIDSESDVDDDTPIGFYPYFRYPPEWELEKWLVNWANFNLSFL